MIGLTMISNVIFGLVSIACSANNFTCHCVVLPTHITYTMLKATSFLLNDAFTMARDIYFTTEDPNETLDVLFPWKYILSTSNNHNQNI